MAKSPHVNKARRYAREVVKGKIPACKYVVQACQRFLDDLEASKNKNFPFTFNRAYAEHACAFIEALPHTKGQWAAKKENIVLQPWQTFIVCNLFGWVEKKTKLRRFREFYGEIPRKNGKSLLAAAIGLLLFSADGEHGAEVYSGATSEEQAWEVFRPAKIMAEKTKEFREATGTEVAAKSLFIVGNGSRFKPVIGKPGDGPSPHGAIVDEYHEHLVDDLYSTMKTGMGSRTQPMMFVITTAGTDLAGPCYSLRGDAIKVLEGTINNDRLFAVVYTIDEDDNWVLPETLIKANPNYDVSVSGQYLKQQQQEAIDSARKQNTFKTKHMNVWCHARSPWINMENWHKAADPTLVVERFENCSAKAGVDTASKKDLTAWVRVFKETVDDIDHYYVFAKHWLPELTAEEPDKKHYGEWLNTEHLKTTEGNMIDLDVIEEDIQAATEIHKISDLGFDPWGAYQLASNLQEGKNGRKITVTEIPMTVKHLSEPMKHIEALVDAGRVHHNGDPILAWCVSNVTVKPDANDNIFPRKERDEQKIDAAVAMILAFNRELFGEDEKESVYKTRGIRTI
jgi:phage terminase large subunit-like protein